MTDTTAGTTRDDTQDGTAGTFCAYVVTDDPDGLFARATAAGARVVGEPADTHYGSREFVVRDPEGNHWSFGTCRGEPRR